MIVVVIDKSHTTYLLTRTKIKQSLKYNNHMSMDNLISNYKLTLKAL